MCNKKGSVFLGCTKLLFIARQLRFFNSESAHTTHTQNSQQHIIIFYVERGWWVKGKLVSL